MTSLMKDTVLKAFESLLIARETKLLEAGDNTEGVFVSKHTAIVNPYLSENFFDEVDPQTYYGQDYTDWYNNLPELLFTELNKMREDVQYAADHFNEVLTDTGLFAAYEERNLSYDKYRDNEGWSNALFHYFKYDHEDLSHWKQWVDDVITQEKERLGLNPTLPKP